MATTQYPPGPPATLPAGYNHVIAFARDPIAALTRTASYGDFVPTHVRGRTIFFVNNPDYVKDVLVTHQRDFDKGESVETVKWTVGNGLLTAEGDFWLRQRRMIQPAFHRQRIAAYAETMAAYADRTSRTWRDGATLDIHEEMMHLTLEIVVKCLFDADIETSDPQLNTAMSTLANMGEFARIPVPIARVLYKMPLPPVIRYRKAMVYVDNLMYGMINDRRKSGEDRGDLLSMLVHAHDEEGGMSAKQVRDELLTFFLAGHETTALALTWTWYLLSQNPEAEARLHAELDSVLGGRLPTVSDVPNLRYTEMVLSEAMRLYPPAYVTSRTAIKETVIGDYSIPPKSIALLSPYTMHHNPRYWPDPEKFDPERFTAEAKANRPRFAYYPFGGGPRQCIGEPFAWMEGVLLLAALGQHWQLRHAPDHKVEVRPLVTLRPAHGMRMILHQRTPAHLAQQSVGSAV